MSILFHITAGTDSWVPTADELNALKHDFIAAMVSDNLASSFVATRQGVQLNIIQGPDYQAPANEQQQEIVTSTMPDLDHVEAMPGVGTINTTTTQV